MWLSAWLWNWLHAVLLEQPAAELVVVLGERRPLLLGEVAGLLLVAGQVVAPQVGDDHEVLRAHGGGQRGDRGDLRPDLVDRVRMLEPGEGRAAGTLRFRREASASRSWAGSVGR